MNGRRNAPPPRTKAPVYRQAFERLDKALEKNIRSGNAERIRLMRQAYFADVDKLEKSGEVVLPD